MLTHFLRKCPRLSSGLQKQGSTFRQLLTLLHSSSKCSGGGKLPDDSHNVPAHFDLIGDKEITEQTFKAYHRYLNGLSKSDIIVVGGGLAGLAAAYELTKYEHRLNITLVDRNYHLGGTHWTGSTIFPAMVLRRPAHKFLDELGVTYAEHEHYVVVPHAASLVSAVIHKVLSDKRVTFLGGAEVADLLVDRGVSGVSVVIPASQVDRKAPLSVAQQAAASPIPLHCPIVISACGQFYSSSVMGTQRMRLLGVDDVFQMTPPMMKTGSVNFQKADNQLVRGTRAIAPGLFCCGVELSLMDGLSVPGISNAAIIESGVKAGRLALEEFVRQKNKDDGRGAGLETASHFIGDKI